MDPNDFLKTIYLHDRGCTALFIDCVRKRVSLGIDAISRIRNPSGNWDFYRDEDIENGRIVFTSVESLSLSSGPLPNDYIFAFTVEPLPRGNETAETTPRYVFRMDTGSVDKKGEFHPVTIEVVAESIHLEDPSRPGVEIVT